MELLTKIEAQQYIPCSGDYLNSKKCYFAITEGEDGWENVTYYTNIKVGVYAGKEGNQWVYILSNPTMPNILKIGYTKFLPHIRSKQISNSTGVPTEFIVEWAYKCFNGEELEKEVHMYLEKHRLNKNREFFSIDLIEAQNIITTIGNKYI